jgi:hypothetical protein
MALALFLLFVLSLLLLLIEGEIRGVSGAGETAAA